MRACARQAQRLARTADRPQAFAVYGASQAGKSYLMGELSAPEKGEFMVTWPGEKPVGFIGADGLNPQNEGESSGLVSRFTTRSLPESSDPSAPIPIQFLSPADVVLIIGNAFFSDFDLKEDHQDLEKEIMPALALLEPDTEAGLLDINDIEELEEYFREKFASNAQFVPFKQPDYWDWLRKNAPRLSLRGLVQALSPLWRKSSSLTSYVRELLGALEQLGAPDVAFCGIDALLPSSDSILNVAVLSSPGGRLRVVTPDGKSTSISRPVGAALVAELSIPLTEPRWQFQANTDLLDFPGARSREIYRDLEDARGKEGHLFLRGKVDYLFQRYQDNMEVTATLLCVGPSNQEVKTLPTMIEDWVDHTIGATPAERQAKDDALFFILTKFDSSLAEGDGHAPDSTSRWDRRLEASMVKPFGDSGWLKTWKPGHSFDNTFWLRAPRFGRAYRKDAEGLEIPGEYVESLAGRIDAMRAAHARSEKVRKYIHNPDEAFDAVMTPNDGGITYLVQKLQRLSTNGTKEMQVNAALDGCLLKARTLASSFYHDPSTTDEDRKAREEAKAFTVQSLRPMQQQGRYGRFLERLVPDTSGLAAEWRLFNSETSATKAPAQQNQDKEATFLASLFGDEESSPPDQVIPPANTMGGDRFDRFAARILDYWHTQTLDTLLADSKEGKTERAYFSLSPETLKPFLQQLWRLREKGAFADHLAAKLREQCSHESPLIQRGDKAAIICAEMLGRFVTCMGFPLLPAGAPDDGRPKNPLTAQPIFTAPPEPGRYPDIHDDRDSGEEWLMEWCVALIERFRELGPSFDPVANESLGKILGEYARISTTHPSRLTTFSSNTQ
nr:virulence factor SrfC family protein [Komagataeibacter sp. FNDCR2]